MADSAVPPARLRADFDRIAELPDPVFDNNTWYHDLLLREVPSGATSALDIGCGTGAFTRRLAERVGRVLGIDLSPRMVEAARARTSAPNVEYRVADATRFPFPPASFDVIASIATLHHLPLESMLLECASALRPGGVLLLVDVHAADGLADLLLNPLAMFTVGLLRLRAGRGLVNPPEVREAWAEHAKNDRLLPLKRLRRRVGCVLPGARVRRHLLWRWSLVWRRPC
jgi:SAM-dependent methyltransferase